MKNSLAPFPVPPLLKGSPTQRGAALVTGLILLVLLTIIGITAMRTSGLEERMAGYLRDRNLAFQAAEAALRDAESYLTNPVVGPFNNRAAHASGMYDPRVPCSAASCGGSYTPACTTTTCKQWWEVLAWTNADSAAYSATLAGVAQQPRYIIEDVSGTVKCVQDGFCQNIPLPTTPGGSIKFGVVPDIGMYRITARGVGAQTDGAGNPLTVVLLQSYYRR